MYISLTINNLKIRINGLKVLIDRDYDGCHFSPENSDLFNYYHHHYWIKQAYRKSLTEEEKLEIILDEMPF